MACNAARLLTIVTSAAEYFETYLLMAICFQGSTALLPIHFPFPFDNSCW